MHVAVLNLFCRCFANVGDIDIKMQCLTRQWMIGVNGDIFVVHRFYYDQLYLATRTLGLELHANFDLVHTLESVARNSLNQLWVHFAVGISRLNCHFQCIAGNFAFQFALQPGDDTTVAVQVCERLTALR